MLRAKIISDYLRSVSLPKTKIVCNQMSPDYPVKISIVVPVYNEKDNLPNLFAALSKQIYKNFNLIVVDNGSTDASRNVVTELAQKGFFKTYLVEENKPGVGNARKTGMDFATHLAYKINPKEKHIILITDADTLPNSLWTKTVVNRFKEINSGALSGTHGAKESVDELIEDKLGLIHYFNKIPSVIEWFQKNGVGIIKMNGQNSAFEIEAYCAAGGMYQPKDIVDDSIVVEGTCNLGQKLNELGYPILPMFSRVGSNKRRQLAELINNKQMYITETEDRILAIRDDEDQMLKYALKNVSIKSWKSYQFNILKSVVSNTVIKPLLNYSIGKIPLINLLGKIKYKNFKTEAEKLNKATVSNDEFLSKWTNELINIYENFVVLHSNP